MCTDCRLNNIRSIALHKNQNQVCSSVVSLKALIKFRVLFNRVYYMYKILAALIFSCIGDALLDHDRFVYGMCAFASAQICYIMAFGFQPLKLWIGIPLYIFGALGKISR